MNTTITPEERATREAQFHDERAAEADIASINVDAFFNSPTAQENRRILEFFGTNLKGKRILDIGCGYGEASVYFASRGAIVEALDVSEGMLVLARQLAARYQVQPRFQKAEAEKLPFPDNTFDFVYGNGVLHHVTLEVATPEIRRVLKPGGKAAFIEPLPFNPAINVYRKMATKYRSEDEHPISMKQLRFVLNSFRHGSHNEFWITGLAVFFWMYAIQRVHPNDTPYWKKIIYDAHQYRFLTVPLIALDKFLTRLPLIRWLAWNTVLMTEK